MNRGTEKGTVLITGGAKRIGRAMALTLAGAGYNIIIHYNKSKDEAKQTKEEVEKLGAICGLVQADLDDSKQYKSMMEKAFTLFPSCNILINNASIFERGSFLETTEELFDRHMNINFKAPFFLSQAFSKCCRNGLIINVLDSYITKETGAYYAYLLSKKSLYSFNRMAAKALAPHIRVNGIAIGTTEISKNLKGGDLKKKRDTLPLKQEVKVKHVTHTMMDIINNHYITGQCVFVDGGDHLL